MTVREKHPGTEHGSGLHMSDATDAGILARMMHEAAEKLGLDTSEVLNRLDVKKQEFEPQNSRMPYSNQIPFWEVMQEVSGDPQIGLHMAENAPVFRGQVIEYLFLSSPSFGEGLVRSLNYQRLLSDSLRASLSRMEDENTVRLSLPTPEGSIYHAMECLMVNTVKFYTYITDGAFSLIRVDFSHQCHGDPDEYQRVFSCPVKFEQPDNAIYIPQEVMDTPSPHAEPTLLKLHENAADGYMTELRQRDYINKINHHIGALLATKNVSLETVAERMGIKKQSLKAKLAKMDIGFNQLLTDYRITLSKHLLSKTNEPMEKIISLTGFSEPSAFYRAFKRWVGKTPMEYRNSMR